MTKLLKVTRNCPNPKCKIPVAIPISIDDVGKSKFCECPKCHVKFGVVVPESWGEKFVSDQTKVESMAEKSLLLETVKNEMTDYQSFALTADYYTLGRKNNSGPEHRPDVEVVTIDKSMSRVHAAISKVGAMGFSLKDLGSKNGTFLNGNRLEANDEVYLNDGDMIRMGQTELRVSITENANGLE